MYLTLLTLHSVMRWVVLSGLLFGLFRAYRGWLGHHAFTPLDNTTRHTVATLAHVQLLLGFGLYAVSPVAGAFHFRAAEHTPGGLFFGVLHVVLMVMAIVVLTVGSALAKRRPAAPARFRTMALWFTAALLLMLLAVPWPFSPLASRPYFRF